VPPEGWRNDPHQTLLALLRCHGVKRNGILLNVLAPALWTSDFSFIVFPEGED